MFSVLDPFHPSLINIIYVIWVKSEVLIIFCVLTQFMCHIFWDVNIFFLRSVWITFQNIVAFLSLSSQHFTDAYF